MLIASSFKHSLSHGAVYPIAYNKWIREQIEDILGLPELYPRRTRLFEIRQFESPEIVEKAKEVEQLLDSYAPGQ